jgi:hypothetical protein
MTNTYADSRDDNYNWLFGDMDIPSGMWLELHRDLDYPRYRLLLMDASGPLEAMLIYPSEERMTAKEMIGNPMPTFLLWIEQKKKLEKSRRQIVAQLGF